MHARPCTSVRLPLVWPTVTAIALGLPSAPTTQICWRAPRETSAFFGASGGGPNMFFFGRRRWRLKRSAALGTSSTFLTESVTMSRSRSCPASAVRPGLETASSAV